MNRRERRIADKQNRAPATAAKAPIPSTPIVAAPSKPGWLLRGAAKILLSRFALRRVSHPHVLGLLREVARQAGRMDAVIQIQAKLEPHEQ